MKGNYNRVTPFYDALAKVIFSNRINDCQAFLVQFIPANATVLIVGGGTGYILTQITHKYASGLHITYVEKSEAMIQEAKKRPVGKNTITFINTSIESASLNTLFNVIITPFLFDNFSHATAQSIFYTLNNCLQKSGTWLYADFNRQANKWWQKALLKVMYGFFRLVCNIEANRIPPVETFFEKANYTNTRIAFWYKRLICAIIYTKAT